MIAAVPGERARARALRRRARPRRRRAASRSSCSRSARSERTRGAITSHTGGLAGEARVFSAVLRAHRAIEVDDLDEMTEVLAACQARALARAGGASPSSPPRAARPS